MQKILKSRAALTLIIGICLALFTVLLAQFVGSPQCTNNDAYEQKKCVASAGYGSKPVLITAGAIVAVTILLALYLMVADFRKTQKRQKKESAESAKALVEEAKESVKKKSEKKPAAE